MEKNPQRDYFVKMVTFYTGINRIFHCIPNVHRLETLTCEVYLMFSVSRCGKARQMLATVSQLASKLAEMSNCVTLGKLRRIASTFPALLMDFPRNPNSVSWSNLLQSQTVELLYNEIRGNDKSASLYWSVAPDVSVIICVSRI